MADKFSPGDIVQLKSGGPAMTVSEIKSKFAGDEATAYRCTWFKGASKEYGDFREETLEMFDTLV